MGRFEGVADTLYIPLTSRIYVSKRFPSFFYDEKALELEGRIATQGIAEKTSEYFHMASVCRFREIDEIVRTFSARHERCNIVHLGCGLETAYFRIRPQNAIFYELDLPDVIALRREVLGESEHEVPIGGDLFDLAWADGMDTTLPTLLTAVGVFMYFPKERILTLFERLKARFSDAQIVFDAANKRGLDGANRHVQKTGNADAKMSFYVDDAEAFSHEVGLTLLEQRPFFCAARRQLKKELSLYTRIAMFLVDSSGMGKLLHLQF